MLPSYSLWSHKYKDLIHNARAPNWSDFKTIRPNQIASFDRHPLDLLSLTLTNSEHWLQARHLTCTYLARCCIICLAQQVSEYYPVWYFRLSKQQVLSLSINNHRVRVIKKEIKEGGEKFRLWKYINGRQKLPTAPLQIVVWEPLQGKL